MVHNQIAVAIIAEELPFDNPFYRKNVNLRTNRWGRGAGHASRRLQQIPHIGGRGVCPLSVGDDPQIHRFGDTGALQYR